MIHTDRQYTVSLAQLAKLKAELEAIQTSSLPQTGAWLVAVEVNALKSQISEIEGDIAEYDLLKSGKVAFSETSSLTELPRVLVQARIARGLSQTDLATRLKMKPQQVQRYEATNYMSASLARLIDVADALDVKVSETYEQTTTSASGSIFSWAELDDIVWQKFPWKEMRKRKWLDIEPGEEPGDACKRFFLSNAGPQFASALHRKKLRGTHVPDEYSLLAWQTRVLSRANRLCEAASVRQFQRDNSWLHELVRLTRDSNGPARARELLHEHGVILVVEPHLPGTYLDGAAMVSKSGCPVVALTLRHDRLDNFWFVLFHELGHVFLHLFDNLRFDFFDEEGGSEMDGIEKAADQFALDTLIPPPTWDKCLSRFAISDEAVRIDAENLGLHPSIIAGRIRKERNNYMILAPLVGQSTVRAQFGEAGL